MKYNIFSAPLNAVSSTLAYRAVAFGYANSRIKSMKQSLLDEKELNALSAARDLNEIISMLEKTAYREELVEQSAGHDTAEIVEHALGRNLEKTVSRIKRITPKIMQKQLQNVLQRFDVHNIKTILLAKHLGKKQDDILPILVFAGTMPRADVLHMLSLESVEKNVLLLGKTDYGSALEKYLPAYKATQNIQPMLNALDQYYLSAMLKNFTAFHASDKIVLELLRAEVDKKNIANILRGKLHSVPEKELEKSIIPNGSIRRETLKKMVAAKDIEEAAKLAGKRFDLGRAMEKFSSDKKISHFEIALETMVLRKSLKALRRSILSIGTIIGFIILKEEETKNIRKIAKAKEFGMQGEEMEEMVVRMGT